MPARDSRRASGLLGLLLATSMAMAGPMQPGQVEWRSEAITAKQAGDVHDRVAQVRARLAAGDGKAALAAMVSLEDDPLRQHWALHDILRGLRDGEPLAQAESLLAYAASLPVRVVRRHEETAADWFHPQFDPAGAAADVRFAWDVARQRDAFAAEIARRGSLPALDAEAAASTIAGLVAAIEALPVAEARRIARGLSVDGLAPEPALAVARRSGDVALTDALLRDPRAEVRFRAFQQLLPRHAPAQQRQWLDALEGDAQLASAAMVASATLLIDDGGEGVLPALLGRLDDAERGAATALALARHDDALRWIDLLWARSESARQQRMLLLALTLHDTPESRARQQHLAVQQGGRP